MASGAVAQGTNAIATFYLGSGTRSSPALGRDGTVYIASFGNPPAKGQVYAVYLTNGPTFATKWTGPFDAATNIYTSPVLSADDSTLYIHDIGGTLYALNTTNGALLWTNATAHAVGPTPAVGNDGSLYSIGGYIDSSYMDRWYLMCLSNANGGLKWEFPANTNDAFYGTVYDGLVIAADGTVYVGCDSESNVWVIPECSGGGSGFGAGVLYAIGVTNGVAWQKWQFPAANSSTVIGALYGAPSIDGNGILYFGTLAATNQAAGSWVAPAVHAVDPIGGSERWALAGPTQGPFEASPTIGPDGTIYIGEGSYVSYIYGGQPEYCEAQTYPEMLAITNGAVRWAYTNNAAYVNTYDYVEFDSTPAVSGTLRSGASLVYTGSGDLTVYGFDPAGSNGAGVVKWRSAPSGNGGGEDGDMDSYGFESGPVIAPNGVIYITSWDGYLYAFCNQTNIGLAPTSFWPMFGENRRHSQDAQDNRWTESPAPVATIVDLGTLDNGDDYSEAEAINNLDNVTGDAECISSGTTYDYAFWYTPNSGMSDLGGLCSAQTSSGLGINALNAIVGYAYDCYGAERAFYRTIGHALVQLQEPSGWGYAVGEELNDGGMVAGSAEYSSSWHAVFWTNSTAVLTDMGTLGGTTSYAYGINNDSWVVGESLTSNGVYHAFAILEPGYKLQAANDLGTMSGTNTDTSIAFAVNGIGQIVGASTGKSGTMRFFLKYPFSDTNGFQDLGPGSSSGFGGINGRGQAVVYGNGLGIYVPALGNQVQPLANYLSSSDQSAWTLETAMGIAADGSVVGWGYHYLYENGSWVWLPRAYLISPNPISVASGGMGCGGGGGGGGSAPTAGGPLRTPPVYRP